MRQFDVYANTNSATRDAYPFIVDIQSNVIAQISTRIVIPLGRKSAFGSMTMDDLTPVVTYDGEELLLLVPQIASVPARILKDPIGSLSHMRDDIISALDFAITGT